jgi:hypothetical protein
VQSPNFKVVRRRVLEQLVAGALNVDRHLAQSGELVLTRIVSWLRLNFSFSEFVALQLDAISTFLHSAGAAVFLKALVKCGGVGTCMDIATAKSSNIIPEDRHAAFRVLTLIADAGRAYKMFVCQAQCIPVAAACMVEYSHKRLQETCKVYIPLSLYTSFFDLVDLFREFRICCYCWAPTIPPTCLTYTLPACVC